MRGTQLGTLTRATVLAANGEVVDIFANEPLSYAPENATVDILMTASTLNARVDIQIGTMNISRSAQPNANNAPPAPNTDMFIPGIPFPGGQKLTVGLREVGGAAVTVYTRAEIFEEI